MTNHAVVEGFIPIRKCWELLFPDNSLCFRSFQQLQLDNKIPYRKIGQRVLVVLSEVRSAIDKQFKREVRNA